MFEDIANYMMKSREERRAHLQLDDMCMEIGGASSVQYRGLLAHHLRTTIPSNKIGRVYLCHACNNCRCSNPKHLYWGTPQDNHLDQVQAGTFKAFPQSKKQLKRRGQQLGLEYGKLNGGKNALTSQQLHDIKVVLDSIPKKWGWINEAATALDVTHTQVRRYIKKLKSMEPVV